MFSKIFSAVQSTLQEYPSAIQQGGASVKKALNWINSQPFGSDVKELVRRIEFTVNFGAFPEFGTQRFTVTKQSGDMRIFGSTERKENFELSINGLIKSVKAKTAVKRGDANVKATEAKARADEAGRLAAEALRLATEAKDAADAAEREALTFESAVSGFEGYRRVPRSNFDD